MKIANKVNMTGSSEHAQEAPLLIIGNGMVGHRFCQSVRSSRDDKNVRPLMILGEESHPAYDRVNLTDFVERDAEEAYLAPVSWYSDEGIDLQLGVEVVSVNTETKQVLCRKGKAYSYSQLVLATGSTPFVPPIPGIDQEGVILYRTLEDLAKIRNAAQSGARAAVVGGGLLGLEAARAILDLGAKVVVLEIADYLMPQQLDPPGGELLAAKMIADGIDIKTSFRTQDICSDGNSLVIRSNDLEIEVDFVVVSTGIRPSTTYLEDSPIHRNPRGHIIVNGQCQTNIPDVFAIGECAACEGKSYGLVAPGYEMADTLAAYLEGDQNATFTPPDVSIRLKVAGVEVSVLGDFQQADTLTTTQTWKRIGEENDAYRKLILKDQRLVGGIFVGDFGAVPRVQDAIAKEQRLSAREIERFVDEGDYQESKGGSEILFWPDDAEICNCMKVSKGRLMLALSEGCNSVESLGKKTGAGTVCGSCQPLLLELLDVDPKTVKVPMTAWIVLGVSALACVGVGLTMIAQPLAYARSVEGFWFKFDQLWRDGTLKQITGYSLFALCLFAMALPVQRRFKRLKFGQYSMWRALHTATGLLGLLALFLHTGFHLGDNFNSWLFLVFALLNLFGGLAGIFAGLDAKGAGKTVRTWRPILTWAHLLLFWPLPLLVFVHIFTVYYW